MKIISRILVTLHQTVGCNRGFLGVAKQMHLKGDLFKFLAYYYHFLCDDFLAIQLDLV